MDERDGEISGVQGKGLTGEREHLGIERKEGSGEYVNDVVFSQQ